MVMAYPDTRMTSYCNLWVRQMHFKNIGDKNEGHIHNFDHLTLLAKGKVIVDVEGNKTEFTAPHVILTAAGKRHFIEALEDETVAYCVHALRNAESAESEILLEDQIPRGVDPFSLKIVKAL
jgi:quercetin dioxygenase-like cupin family protein